MPTVRDNGKTYNVAAQELEQFTKEHPNATIVDDAVEANQGYLGQRPQTYDDLIALLNQPQEQEQLTPQTVREMVANAATGAGLPQPSREQAQQPTPAANATPTEEVTPKEVQPQEPSEDEMNKVMAQRQLDDLLARRDLAKDSGHAETANTLQKQIDNLLSQVPDLARETMAPSKPEDLAAPQEQQPQQTSGPAFGSEEWKAQETAKLNLNMAAFDAYTSGMVADTKERMENTRKAMAAGGSTVEITSSFAPTQPLYTNITGNVYPAKFLADMDNAYAKDILKGQSEAINERERLEAQLPQWREQLADKQKELETIERPSSSASYLDEAPMIEGEIAQLQQQIEGAEARLGYIDEELATGNDPSINGMVKRQQKIVDELQKKLDARYAELRAQMDELAAQSKEKNPIATTLTRGYVPRAEYAAMNNDELVRAYSLALRTAQKTLQALQDQAKREAGGEVGFWRAFGRTLTDISLWDFGLSGLGDALIKLNIASGEFKTPEEQAAAEAVLQQTYYNQLVEQQFGANRNLREKGGEMTAEMAPYMLDFLISGGESALSRGAIRMGERAAFRAVGRETYRAIGKGAYRYLAEGGLPALGRELEYFIPKYLGVAASDLIRAGQVTFGPRIVSNVAQVMENRVGDVEEKGGTLRFENKESLGRAAYNAFMDDFLESLSEMSGTHLEWLFSGKSAAKVAKWLGAKNLSQQLTWADAGTLGDIMRQTRRLFHKVELSGLPEEISEEYVGQALKSIFNLDTAYYYDDNGVRRNLFTSGDFHAEIWSGMAMSMGMLEGLRQAYGHVRYRMVKHGLDLCDATAQELLKGRWADLKEQIDNTKNEDAGAFFQNLWKMSGLSEEQMTAVSDYMTTLLAMRGLNLAQERRTAIRKEIGEDIANAAGEQRSNQNYLMGYSITDGGQRNGIRNIMTAAMQQLNELLGVAEDGTVIGNGVIAEIDAALDDPAELERIIAAHTEWGEREQRAVRNYIDAKQTYDGMIQRSRDDIDVGIAHQKAEIDSYTNKTTGKVQGATMKQDDRRVYIISGVVVPYDDRTGINTQASDKSVMVMDQNTGKIEMVSAGDILITDDEELDPEDMKRQVEENLRASMSEEAAKQINGTVSFAEGTTHVVIDENGEPETVTIVPNEDGVIDNGDGTVNVTSDGGQTIRPMNKQYIQQQSQEQGTIRAGQAIAWSSGEVPQEQAPAQSQVPQVTATPVTEGKYGLNKKIRLRDSNGNEVVGTINSRNDVQHNYQYEVEIDGRIVPMTEEELDAAYIGEVEGAATEGALAQIPVNEQGERVYEQAQSPAVAWDALVEESEGDTGMAQETANEMVSTKQAELKAAQEAQQQPTQGTTPTEKIAEKKAKAAAVAKAQADLAFWEAVANEQQRRANAEAQKQAAPQQEQQKQQPQQQKGESRKSVTESQQKQEEAKQIRMQSARALQERINKLAADIRKWVDGLGLHVPVRIARTQKELVDIAAEIDANNRAKAEKEANEKGLTGKERRTYINKHSTNYAARIQQNLQRGTVSNAFVTNDGTVVMYAPALYNGVEGVLDPTIRHQRAMARAHEVFAHEAVAHRGLQDLLGKEGFKKLCDEIYKGMSKAARERFVAYQWNYNMSDSQKGGLIGKAYAKRSWQSLTAAQRNKVWANKDAAEKLRRGAADEYAAHLAEKVLGNETLTPKEQSVWQKILSAIRKLFGQLDDTAIAQALVQARDNLRSGAQAEPQIIGEEGERFSVEEEEPKPIGKGAFGDIYDQFRGKPKEAIAFLTRKGSGEAIGALHHKDIGDIDLVWGEEGTGKSDGYGLAKLVKYHPEVLNNLQEILDDMHIVTRSENRINLESDKYYATVRLTWDDENKTWLLTAFEKTKSSAPSNTTDTAKTLKGKRNDTATPQNATSESKGSENSENARENAENLQGEGEFNTPQGEARFSAEEAPQNEDLFARAERITREQQEQDAQPTAEEILAKVKGQKQVGVEFEPLTQDEVDDIRFSIGKKRRTQMEATLDKRRPDLSDEERNALFSYLDDLNNTKEENATFKWFVEGTVRLPEDREKIRQAIKTAELAKVDPMQYSSPDDLMEVHKEFKPKDAPIDPDTLPDYLYNKKSYGNGIVVYDVLDGDPDEDDVNECRQWLRKIINTHWGEDANPWCLLQGDGEGHLTRRSAGYWDDYNRFSKKMAFKDGRLLAFFGGGVDENEPTWWDRKDYSYSGIPVTMKMPNDPLGRSATYEYNIPMNEIEDWDEDFIAEDTQEAQARIKEIEGHIAEADKRIDEIEDELGDIDARLDEIGDLLEDLKDEDDEANQEGIEALEDERDSLESDRDVLVDEQNDLQSNKDAFEAELAQEEDRRDDLVDKNWKSYYHEGLSEPRNIHTGNKKNGVYTEWYNDKPDQMKERTHYKDGMMNGLRETWYSDGQIAIRANYKDDERDGLWEEWDSNGQQTRRANYKDGERNGLDESWYPNGKKREREYYKDGERDGLQEYWHEDGKIETRCNYKDGKRDGAYESWYENGQLHERDTYKNGERDGLSEEWWPNGQIKERTNYKNGKENGLSESWEENGRQYSRMMMEDGKVVQDLTFEDDTTERNSVNENGNEDLFDRAERIAREYEQQRSGATRMSAAEQTRILLGVAGQQEAGVEHAELSPEDENDIRFSVGKNRKEKWNNILDKRRKDITPEQRTALFDYLDGLNNTKEENATFKWFVEGGVTLPVDRPQIQRALKVAEMAKVDPMQYNSPVELMDAFKELAPKEEPIDPDSLPKYLYNKRVLADGVVVYDVADGRASNKKVKACREWLRKIINTHWGEDANPWCLLGGDGKGNLTQGSAGAWNLYNAEPKRIAFKDGKLLAFYATSGSPKWWDRKDDSYLDGIPVTRKMQDDELGRSATYVLNEATGEWSGPRHIHKGDKRNGEYTEWWDAEHIRSRDHHKNGKMDGIAEAWYIDGTLRERVEWKDGMYDGLEETWWPDGTLQERIHWKEHLRDGLSEHWNEHGILKSRAIYKEGKQDGLTESYHDNGRISERANYKDGKEDGISTTYYTNGRIKTREGYKDGKRNGVHEFWYENGVFGSRHNYKDGKLDGLAEWWYENGQKQEAAHFKDEKRDGTDEFWYEDGTPKSVENYRNGKKHGVQEYWDENGTLTSRESYKNGEMDGTWESWWPNGTLHSRQHFVDGQLDGTSEGWAEEGWYIGRMEWKNGERNGLDELWYPNGQLRERTNYKNGLKDGLDERWHENGQLHIRNNWKNGRMDGLSERWDEKGQLRARENYKNDKLDGLTERWYNDGQMQERVTYKKGLVDGTYESWYRNGQLMAYCEFKDGEYDGIREEWYPNGQIAERAYCKNGLRDGLVEGWAEDGTPIWSKRYENGIEITDEGESADDTPIRMSVEDAEKVLDTVKGQKQVGTQWHISLSDQQEIDGLRFSAEQSIGKKERARITGIVKRNRPNMSDEQCEALMVCLNDLYKKAAAPELLGQKAGKAVNAALKWYLMGDITLPKDGDKVIEAIVRGERANQANQARRARGEALLETDASQYPTLKAMMDALVKYKSKEPPIDPDTVPTLTNKRVLSHGVVIYDVVDGDAYDPAVEESRKNLRRIIDTHWGEDRNPWCLLAGDGKGNLRSDSYGYWNRYNKYPKRVAFQNGRLLAFFASNNEPEWWNYEDKSTKGIPITSKMRGDKLGRSAIREMNEKTGRLGKPMVIFRGNTSNGTYEQWYVDDPDKIQLRANHKDGKLNGLQERWYDNGQIAERAYCKDGLRDGLVEGWYEDGTLRERKNFKNDKKDGLSEYWYENGQINARINYKDGHLNGMDEHWHENGQLEARGEFVNGNREGLHENWDANGMLTRRGNYQDDRVEGLYERWNDGQLVERENWHDGEQDGLQESWWNNGQMRFRGTYKNGVKNGVFEEWTEDGKLKEHITYMDGTYDGLYEIYYLNGKLRTRENYVKGKLAGTVEGWYDNGQMKYRGQRRGGTEIGVSESWYDNGQMESRYHFDDHGAMDGIQEKWYRNGQKKEEIEYAHGEQNGIYKVWFENGQQKINATNKNGKWDGKYEEWWDNGQLGRLEYYKDGNYGDGLQQRWHKNGQLASRAVKKDGKWDGLIEGWHPNGQIYQRVPYKEGLREGPYEEWDEYGRLEKRINYKNNEKDGLSEEWYHGGQIKSRLHFKDGEADGSMEYWYDNGQMMTRAHYKTGKGRVGTYEEWWEHNGKPRLLENYDENGIKDGEQKEWNDNGNLKERQYYKDGKKDGVQEKYYYDGQLRIRDNYKNGVLEGEDEQYYSNGQLMSRDHYIDGHLDGISEEWDMDGNLTRRVQWTNEGRLANDLPLEDDTEQRNSVLEREGNGELSDDELSAENDAVSKVVGHNVRTAKQRKAMATRLRREMRDTAEKMAERLHLTDVDILDNGSGLTGALARSKGFYNQRTGKITIIIGNNSSLPDVVKTVLHEAVAHHGLRQLFGTYFDEFLDNVYKEATDEIRHEIAELASRNGWDFRRATEEYLAELAERMDEDFIVDENGRFPSWWTKVKKYFYDMLNRALGGNFRNIDDIALTDNELRYILWSSYDNLRNPNWSSNVYSQAADIAMRDKLDIGDYNSNAEASIDQQVANANDILMREGEARNSVDEEQKNLLNESFKTDTKADPHQGDIANIQRTSENAIEDEDLFARAERIARDYEEDLRMSVEYERMEVADWYERLMSSGRYQSVEAFMDSMLSLKKVMEKIFPLKKGQHVEDIPWFENAYTGENSLSSRNEAELNAVRQLLVDPLTQAVHRLTGGRQSERETMTRYMMAKHGLERNVYMAQRDAQAEFEEYQKEHPRGTKTLQDFINEKRMKDYAGLTALTGIDDVYDAERMAQEMVDDYEGSHSSAAIKNLWDKARALNAMTLSKQYESGFLTRANYDKISGMYQYYIPLRGFDEDTSEDVYAYIGHQSGVMNAPIKKAKGRKSRADDPIAVMQAMAESAVLTGNRNVFVKQRFMNFVMNHPSDLMSISELWLEKDANGEWVPVLPPQNPDDIAQWEQDMAAKAAAEPDRYAKASDTMSIPYRVLSKKNLEQHQVIVRRGGRDYILTVNGSPRLAQAINGETNPDNPNKEGWSMALLDSFGAINRALSGIYTTMNPDFIVSNFCRDMIYSNSMVWVKEKPKYARQFHKNIMRANPMMIKILFAKLRNGRLNMDNELERLFYEFITNGGETGYARRTDTEEIKRKFEKSMRTLNEKIPATEIRNLAATVIGEIGRSVELCARFAAFITSREDGRDIDRSVYDGKEISVNFNKKGSGDKFFGAQGQTRWGNVSAFTSGMGRALYLFWNASLQGTFGNFFKNIARHPGKGAILVASYLALGMARAWLGAIGGSPDGDDDEMPDSYFNFSQYTRRSNLIIKGTGKAWIKIPLSIEYRAIYGLGEMFGSALFRGEKITMNDYMEQVCQLMPLDMTEGRNEHTKNWTEDLANWIRPLIPAILKPMFEVGFNYNYMGRPIYIDKKDYTEWVPAWMRVYPTTNQTIVNFCKWLNERGDGDMVDRGHGIDINPAGVEYLLRSYVPFYTFVNEIMNTIDVARGAKDYNPMYIPLLNRVMAYSNDRTGNGALTGDFYRMRSEIDRTESKYKGYLKNIKHDHNELRQKLYDLVWSPDFARYQAVKPYVDGVSDLSAQIRQDDEVIANREKQELTDEQKLELDSIKENAINHKAQRQWLMEQALWINGQIRNRDDYYKMKALRQLQIDENEEKGIEGMIDMTTINVHDKENQILESKQVKEMVDSMRTEDEENFKKIPNQE